MLSSKRAHHNSLPPSGSSLKAQPPATSSESPSTTSLTLPKAFLQNSANNDDPFNNERSSLVERGITAACKEYPAALPHLIRFLPVSATTKQRVAESALSDIPLVKALDILSRLRFPSSLESEITMRLVNHAIKTFSSVESLWRAVHIKITSGTPPQERLALALRCVALDPEETVQRITLFDLNTPELQVPFARAYIRRSGIATLFTIPWLQSLGATDPAGALEIAELCISHSPFDTAMRLTSFGLPVAPLIERVISEVGTRHRWKVLARVCAIPDIPDDSKTALVDSSFERYPHDTLRQLPIFRLPEGDTIHRLLREGLSLNQKAVVSYLQKNASPFFRDIAEQSLWSCVSNTPWEAADVAIRADVTSQSLLSALALETFTRDPARSLRFIRESRGISQETLGQLAIQLSAIDAVAVSRNIKTFGALPNSTLITIAHRVAVVDPKRALDHLTDPLFRSEESRRELLLSMAKSPEGAKRAADALHSCLFSAPETRFLILERCAEQAPDATIKALRFAGLSERSHAQIVARIASGDAKKSRELLAQVGVYSKDALVGLFPGNFVASYESVPPKYTVNALRSKVKTGPAKVAANIFSCRLSDEQQRVDVAVSCAKRAPRAVGDKFLSFGIYSDGGRKAVAAALCRNSVESLRDAIKLCGVTSPGDIQDLIAPLVIARPRLLSSLEGLSREPWSLRFFTTLFAHAITEHRWRNAFEISKVAAAKNLGREPRLSESLRSFDNLLAEMKNLPSLNEDTRYNITLVERARRAGTIPENAVLRAFTIFDESTDSFVVEILQQGGPTAGANIVEELTRVYRKKRSVPETDRAVIREFISSGFTGFSRTTLTAAKKAFAQSPEHCRKLLVSWKEVATAILRGARLEQHVEDSPLFANLVYAAYRPVELTVSDIHDVLEIIPDNSHHLDRWKYPSSGYPIRLVELEEVRLKSDQTLDADALKTAAAPILGAVSSENQCSHDEFVQILVKASQRGIDSINKAKLAAFLSNHSKDIRVQGAIRELSTMLPDTISAQATAEAIETMKAFYTVIWSDMLDGALRDYFDGGRLELREQFKARIRNIRKMPADAELSIEQIRETVREELDKVWRQERTLLNRESRKFTSHLGSTHGEYRIYLSKSRPSFFGRAGAGLCTSEDQWSWNEKDFLQMNMVDEIKGRIVGNIQLHIFKDAHNQPAVLARLNPTEKFLLTVSKKTLATEMLACVETFAKDNGLAPYLPGQSDHLHLLTNRTSFAPFLKARYGEQYKRAIKLSGWLETSEIFRLRERDNQTPPQRFNEPCA